ncbi:uncharacterized protein C19orf47 homolog [Aplysia californica]|uniref:Uncharacterized protein C19orf47 homolog n=1 Tax=Aplysia californica TaxID=6500 RepID=A0ABM0JHH1_APLCA|nr:uncharacterized protein C19orf47 homolog [Aplysia californica]
MASMSETSYWINFFTSAGIPAGDATHYAILFTDNRITREMLLDISKEYLTDMGVSRLGDIIAILKHCKSVFNQEAKDKILRSTSLTTSSSLSSSPVLTPRRSTAASRMVNHFTSKHPEAAPMSQIPVPKVPPPDPPKSKRKVSVFDRLGSDGADDITLTTTSASTSPQSVFNRLGGKAAVKRAASSTSLDSPPSSQSDGLPYAGVLKNSGPSPAKKANIKVAVTRSTRSPKVTLTSFKIRKEIKNIVSDEKKSSNIQRPEISTTTEGVLSDHAKKESLSLRDRLGAKHEAATSSDIEGKLASLKAASGTKQGKVSIQDRLGAKVEEQSSSPVVSSTQTISTKKKKEPVSTTSAAKVSGVFSRLGKKSQT